MKLKGIYVVAIPIGNEGDITLRAIETLQNVDFIICEEEKNARRLLKRLGLDKPLELLNEHNEKEKSAELFERFLLEDVSAALISDAGTPVFADPGASLINKAHKNNISVKVVPGASSLMAALMGAGVYVDHFFYYGFLPAKREERQEELKRINSRYNENLIFMETPYRLKQVLNDMAKIFGEQRNAVIAYKLTYPEENFYWGCLRELIYMTADLPKGEFVIIVRRPKKVYGRRQELHTQNHA